MRYHLVDYKGIKVEVSKILIDKVPFIKDFINDKKVI